MIDFGDKINSEKHFLFIHSSFLVNFFFNAQVRFDIFLHNLKNSLWFASVIWRRIFISSKTEYNAISVEGQNQDKNVV